LDTGRSVRYYRGRWAEEVPATGYFVARRPQRFGSAVWCFGRSSNGKPDRLLDLPFDMSTRPWDDAWRLQAALDALSGSPQLYEVSSEPDGMATVAFFSPVPSWAQRRWEVTGKYSRPRGALFSYTFTAEQLAEELRVAVECLWMRAAAK
jgi:hypothetical protein